MEVTPREKDVFSPLTDNIADLLDGAPLIEDRPPKDPNKQEYANVEGEYRQLPVHPPGEVFFISPGFFFALIHFFCCIDT